MALSVVFHFLLAKLNIKGIDGMNEPEKLKEGMRRYCGKLIMILEGRDEQ